MMKKKGGKRKNLKSRGKRSINHYLNQIYNLENFPLQYNLSSHKRWSRNELEARDLFSRGDTLD